MIYLFVALRAEADPWLSESGWKPVESPFSAYEKNNLLLTITGTGPLSASAAVSSILSTHALCEDDVLIQCGIAAGVSNASVGSVYRIHKVTDFNSHRDYYPDLSISDGLPEASLITAGRIFHSDSISNADLKPFLFPQAEEPVLFDMEAAGVLHAAASFLGPHQIICLKIVSDTGGAITKEEAARFSNLLHNHVNQLMGNIQNTSVTPSIQKPDGKELAAQLHCSLTMERQLSQLLHYCQLAGIDWRKTVQDYQASGRLPVSLREEGKQVLEELRHDLLR